MENFVLLTELADVRTGYTLKNLGDWTEESKDYLPTLEYISIIQPKNLDTWEPSSCLKIKSDSISQLEKHLLRSGDLLLANKGVKFNTFLYKKLPEKAIASSSFYVIHINNSEVDSGFLAWYLNDPSAKQYFQQNLRGITIPSITKSVVENLKVPLPSFGRQKQIVELAELYEEEKKLLLLLSQKKQDFIREHIWNIIENS